MMELEAGNIGSFGAFKAVAKQSLSPVDDPLLVATIHEEFEPVGQEEPGCALGTESIECGANGRCTLGTLS